MRKKTVCFLSKIQVTPRLTSIIGVAGKEDKFISRLVAYSKYFSNKGRDMLSILSIFYLKNQDDFKPYHKSFYSSGLECSRMNTKQNILLDFYLDSNTMLRDAIWIFLHKASKWVHGCTYNCYLYNYLILYKRQLPITAIQQLPITAVFQLSITVDKTGDSLI